MRKLLPFLLLLTTLAANICSAQSNAINIVCADCRDAHEYPADFVNFAFNQLYGPESWMPYEMADDFFITNLSNQTVYVDADFVFLGLGFKGLRIPIWPTYILRFTLALPDGHLYTAYRSVFQTSLPVPASRDGEQSDAESSTSYSGGAGDEGGEDDDDYYYDVIDDWEEWEYDDYEGTTWIEDPDEDGNFDDADWCEEC